MLWVNLGLICVAAALAIVLLATLWPGAWPVGRVAATLALQIGGILVVTWFLVERGQALAPSLAVPPQKLAQVWTSVSAAALNSVELILLAVAWGTWAGTAAAVGVAAARNRKLTLVAGVASVVWIVPTFLIAILIQDLQATVYALSGVNVSGSYGLATPAQVLWSAAVLAIRPAVYAFRQGQVLLSDQVGADHVRTGLAKGLRWRTLMWRYITRPAGAGLVDTAASSTRLMFGSLPLVEFFFAYPGLGGLLLASLGVAYGQQPPNPDPETAIGAGVALAGLLAVFEAFWRVLALQVDPRLRDTETA